MERGQLKGAVREMRFQLVSMVFLLIQAGAGSAVASQDARVLTEAAEAFLEEVDQVFAEDVKADALGGLSIALIVGDEIVWERAHGLADVASGRAAETDTIYRIGSISKSVTALLLARLVDDEVIGLDDLVCDKFERFLDVDLNVDYAESVTFRQLASHTSGLIREPRLPGAASGPIEQWGEKILASLPTTSFASKPGERYSYSNIGYGILGFALSQAAEEPFETLVTDHLFTPAKMQSSFFVIPDELRGRVAVGNANRGSETNLEVPAREHLGRGYKVPNGGVYASVGDLCRLIAYTRTEAEPAFSEATWNEVQRVQTPEDPKRGYGLGFFVEVDENGHRLLSHGGSVAGYTAHWAFDPDRRIGVAVLRNYNSGRTNLGQVKRMVREIARLTE